MKFCKRGCCWVPWEGVCARQHKCRCHAIPPGNLGARIRLENFLDSLGDE